MNHSPRNIGSMAALSPSVKFLLIVNVAIFLLEAVLKIPLTRWFELHGDWWRTMRFGQLFTYMFVHGSFTHLLVNSLGLFFIGPTVERTIGSYRFFILYYISGILGGLGWSLLASPYEMIIYGEVVSEYPRCVGASGGVMGILGAFGALYPKAELLLWFVIPVRAWVLVLVLAVWELSEMMGKPRIGGIANAAHLIGGIAGFGYAMTLKYPAFFASLTARLSFSRAKPADRAPPRPAAEEERLSKDEIDHILDKIGKEGMGALTPRERELLQRATRNGR